MEDDDYIEFSAEYFLVRTAHLSLGEIGQFATILAKMHISGNMNLHEAEALVGTISPKLRIK